MARKLSVVLVLAVVLLLAAPALAGGWVVITLDALPDAVRAGEPLTVGFMVRQHGQTPTNGVSPTLHATQTTSGEQVSVAAVQEGETGHFVATVTFPAEGVWEWSISPSPFPQAEQLAPLTVLPAVTPAAGGVLSPPVTQFSSELLRWTAFALFAISAALAALDVRQRQAARQPAAGD